MQCCGRCWRPRYQSLVDALFLVENEGQLDQAHLAALIFYAHSSPDKLGRVSIYLGVKLNVLVDTDNTIDAGHCMAVIFDLMAQCDTHTMNLLVRPTLSMLHTLLESSNTDFHIMATDTFLKLLEKLHTEEYARYQLEYHIIFEQFARLVQQSSSDQIRSKCIECLLRLIDKVHSDIVMLVNIPSDIVALSKHLMQCCQTVVNSINPQSLDDSLQGFLHTLVSQLWTFISCATASSEGNAAVEEFVQDLLSAIVTCGESVPSWRGWNLLSFLLGKLPEAVSLPTDVTLSKHLMQCCQKVVRSIKPQSLDDSLRGFLHTLVSRLKTTIGCTATTEDTLAVIVTCGESLPSCEGWNLVHFLLREVPETISLPTDVALSKHLMQCCQMVVDSINPQSLDDSLKGFLHTLVSRLRTFISCAAVSSESNSAIEELVKEVLSVIVTCGESLPSREGWNLLHCLLHELPETISLPTDVTLSKHLMQCCQKVVSSIHPQSLDDNHKGFLHTLVSRLRTIISYATVSSEGNAAVEGLVKELLSVIVTCGESLPSCEGWNLVHVLLRELPETFSLPTDVTLSKHLMQCCQKVVSSIKPQSLDDSLKGVLKTLISHLRTVISCAAVSSESNSTVEELVKELLAVVVTCGESLPSCEGWNLVHFFLRELPNTVSLPTDVTLSKHLMQCCQKVVRSIKPQSLDRRFKRFLHTLVSRLKTVISTSAAASNESNAAVEELVEEVLSVIVTCGESLPSCEGWNLVHVLFCEVPETFSLPTNVVLSKHLMQCCQRVVDLIRPQSLDDSLKGFLHALISHLWTFISCATASSERNASVEELIEEVLCAVVTCGESLPMYEAWNLVYFLLYDLPETISLPIDVTLSKHLMQCCQKVVSLIKPQSVDDSFKGFLHTLVSRLRTIISCAAVSSESNSAVEELIKEVLPAIVTCGESLPSCECWNLLHCLLHELPEAVSLPTDVALSKHLMQCCQRVVNSIHPQSLDDSLKGFLHTLVSHLRTFISCAAASSESNAAIEELEEEVLSVIVTCGESLPSFECWNLLHFLLCELPKTASLPTDVTLSKRLMQCCQKVVRLIKPQSLDDSLKGVLKTLINLLKNFIGCAAASTESNTTVEELVEEVLSVIVTCGELVPSCEGWNLIHFVLCQLPETDSLPMNVTLSKHLLRCCQRMVQSLPLDSCNTSDYVFTRMKRLWKFQHPDLLPLVLQLWMQALDSANNGEKVPLSVGWSSLEGVDLRSVAHNHCIDNQEFLQYLSKVITLLPWGRVHMETYYRLLVTLPLSLGAESEQSLVTFAMNLQDGTHLGSSWCSHFTHVCVAGLLHCLSVVVGGGTPWTDHVNAVIALRRKKRRLLPERFFLEPGMLKQVGLDGCDKDKGLYFSAREVVEKRVQNSVAS